MATSIAKVSVALTASTGKFVSGMKKSEKSTEKLNRRLQRSKKLAAGFMVALGSFAGFAAFNARTMATIDTLAKTSDKLGIATEQLTSMRLAAELTGVSANTLDMAMQRMVRRVAEAAQGTGEAVKALEELGLDAEYLATLSPDQQFRAIADAMGSVSNQGDRVRLAMRLFDSEGVALVNTLALGRDGLDDVADRANKLGITLSRVDAAKVEQANDAIHMLRMTARGLSNQIAVALAPQITDTANRMTDWAVEGGRVRQVAGGIAKGFVIVQAAGEDVGKVFQILQNIATVAIHGIITSIAGLATTLAHAADSLLTMLGLSSDAVKSFAQTAEDYTRSFSDSAAEAARNVGELTTSSWALGSVGERFRQIDQAASRTSDSIEQVARSIEKPIDTTALDEAADRMRELESFARRVFENTRTPMERFEKQIEMLRDALSEGLIDDDTFKRAVDKAKKELADATSPGAVAEAKTSDFRQVDLNRIAFATPAGVGRDRPTRIESPAIDEIVSLVRLIVQGGTRAIVGR